MGRRSPIDALLINRSYLNVYSFCDNLKKQGADINLDGKVNPIDALLVNRRYIRFIDSFKADDWTFISDTVNVNGANVTNNLKAICSGDVNGSYNPPAKVLSSQLSVLSNNTININYNEPFDIPVYLNDYATLGAMGVKLNIKNKILKILNVHSDIEELIYNITDDGVNIAWTANDEGYSVTPDKPLFVVSCSLLVDSKSIDNCIQISSESVLGDIDANIISTDKLFMPKLILSTQNSALSIQNFPNPFNSQTTIMYSILENANVSINVYNVLGKQVASPVNEFQSAGNYTYKFDRNGLKEGIYYCKMTTDNSKSNGSKTDIMVITK